MRIRFAAPFLALGLILLAGVSPIGAAPKIPDPDACQAIPQRSLIILFATPATPPVPAPATPGIAWTNVPADAADAEAITQVTYALVACLNKGDLDTVLAMVSDNYLRNAFVDGEPADPLARELAPVVNALRGCQTCKISPREGGDRFAIASIANLRELADGRVGMDLVVTSPTGADPASMRVAFVSIDGRWLVDQIVAPVN